MCECLIQLFDPQYFVFTCVQPAVSESKLFICIKAGNDALSTVWRFLERMYRVDLLFTGKCVIYRSMKKRQFSIYEPVLSPHFSYLSISNYLQAVIFTHTHIHIYIRAHSTTTTTKSIPRGGSMMAEQ